MPKTSQKITDTERLDWVIARKATIDHRFRMKTRQGGLSPDNLEPVFCVNWIQPNGDLVEQTPDCDYKSVREAIDGAMGY